MKIISDIIQGSDEWIELRAGKITASRLGDVMTGGKGKTRTAYMHQLAAEIITGEIQETFKSKDMEWGNECEPQARSMYEFATGNTVEEVGFILVSEWFGVSPDGLVTPNGLLEIKCPRTTTQIERYLTGKFPSTYKAQVQGQLLASEREWCDFVSFDPRIQGKAQYFEVRVYRDEDYIKTLNDSINRFVDDLQSLLVKLR